jgi:hypothetical protein
MVGNSIPGKWIPNLTLRIPVHESELNPEADDEALAEPLRRVREAKDTGATGIDLAVSSL